MLEFDETTVSKLCDNDSSKKLVLHRQADGDITMAILPVDMLFAFAPDELKIDFRVSGGRNDQATLAVVQLFEVLKNKTEQEEYVQTLLDLVPLTTIDKNGMIEGGLNGRWTDDTSAEMLELLLSMGYRIHGHAKECNYYVIWQNQILGFRRSDAILDKDVYTLEEKFLLSDLKNQAV